MGGLLCCRALKVDLQLSETAAMSNATAVMEMLTRLRMQGFEISLGHYGAGQTSLMHLVRLPISELVIDTGLTTMALSSREAHAVCKCIVDLGNSLDLRVTASGIESGDTLQLFSQIGTHSATGFFIARPMEADAMQSWITRWKESVGSRWQSLLSPALRK